MIAVELIGVRVDAATNTPVMLLRETSGARRILPIMIGTAEAAAIHSHLQGMRPPRPMTHDLIAELLQHAATDLQSVVITHLDEHTFFAELRLVGVAAGSVSCRPSDAVAVAVRCGCPILVDEAVMSQAGVEGHALAAGEDAEGAEDEQEANEQLVDEFRSFLDDLRPEDFER